MLLPHFRLGLITDSTQDSRLLHHTVCSRACPDWCLRPLSVSGVGFMEHRAATAVHTGSLSAAAIPLELYIYTAAAHLLFISTHHAADLPGSNFAISSACCNIRKSIPVRPKCTSSAACFSSGSGRVSRSLQESKVPPWTQSAPCCSDICTYSTDGFTTC